MQAGDQGSGPRACQFVTGQARTQTGSGVQERELKVGRPWRHEKVRAFCQLRGSVKNSEEVQMKVWSVLWGQGLFPYL